MHLRSLLAGVMLAVLAGSAPALAGKADDTLRVTLRDAIPNVDPYYNTQAAGLIIAIHVWDTLLIRDPETFELKPGLALEWKLVDDRTTEFKLRPDVKFHDGEPFTADDVVYTLNTIIADKKVATPSNYTWIEKAEKVDDLTVRVIAKKPFPAALAYLSSITPIWPKAYREKVGAEEFAKKPIGTGPYKIAAIDSSGEIRLERFDDYFAGSPKGKPAIRNIVFRAVADPTTQMAELIGGKADWIQDINADQFESLSKLPTVKTLRAEVQRIAYVNLAGGGRDNPDSPLKNIKVRQAIFHAIDRETMAKQFMPGGSGVPDIVCFDTQFGCDQSKAVHYDYDPEKAKALLAEAGYPNGFDTELYTYLTPSWGGAIQNYLKAVGINATIQQQAVAAVIKAAQEGKTPLAIAAWSGFGINEVSPYLQYFFTGNVLDQARDEEIHKLVDAGGSTNDEAARLKAYNEAFHLISERAHFLPLFSYVKNYGMSKDLNFKAFKDDWSRFYLATWN
ncbi:ABC transporter substrate-binding protein [Mesorhizobium sp. YR577]|uniref:ABC transporter substrate-binding protein n=1 Tax=Mesorhizobium sp. YR577 TaxID=1884373 RepID=UPI0008E8E65C|nr:ABC transporter substrate-binding protein [Mesorhizobium sp. YR577]SFU21799.1 peptide/nickel transport system substrate-binding protein [Mesorhizobium sp. YR577]